MPPHRPPLVYAPPGVTGDTLAWSDAGTKEFVTLVAKVAFKWRHEGVCQPIEPPPLVVMERHRDNAPTASLETAAELAPWLPHPEVLLVGSAYAPGATEAGALTVQVAVSREAIVLQKSFDVHGDRDARGGVMPFRRMALTWERAARSDDNSVGVSPPQQPNLLVPDQPGVAACMAPIASTWRVRASRLAGAAAPVLHKEPLVLPAEFPGEYFQSAPADQWLAELTGAEWITLDGLCPEQARIVTRLPGLAITGRWMDPTGNTLLETRLAPDRLVIDSDAQGGTLCYRVIVPCRHDELGDRSVLLGVQSEGGAIHWADPADPHARCMHLGEPVVLDTDELPNLDEADTVAQPHGNTRALRLTPGALKAALPFGGDPPPSEQAASSHAPVSTHHDDDALPDQDDGPVEHTMAIRRTADLAAVLPFDEAPPSQQAQDDDALPDFEDAGDEDPIAHTAAMSLKQVMGSAMPFAAQPAAPGEAPGSQAAPSQAAPEPGFDDEEHTALTARPQVGSALPFTQPTPQQTAPAAGVHASPSGVQTSAQPAPQQRVWGEAYSSAPAAPAAPQAVPNTSTPLADEVAREAANPNEPKPGS